MKKLGSLFIILCWLVMGNAVAQEIDEHTFPKGKLIDMSSSKAQQSYYQSDSRGKNYDINRELIFNTTFEVSSDSWSLSTGWEMGNAEIDTDPHSQTPGSVAGTYFNGTYANNLNTALVSPTISLPAAGDNEQIIVEFREWYQIESGYDFGYIEISVDDGSSWSKIHSRNGQSNWRTTRLNLDRYAAEQIKLRFQLTSDSSNSYLGWYIDEFWVYKQKTEDLQANISSLNSQNFPNIYANVQVDTAGSGISDLTQGNFTVYENDLVQTDLFNVTPPEQGGGVRRADIVFLMDNSGSMSEEQNAVENNVFDFVDQLAASNVDFALGLARYGASEAGGNPIMEDGGGLTSDAEYFKNDIWARNVISGANEPGYYTMTEALSNFNFRPGAQRIFIIITDESPNQGGATMEEARTQLVNGGVTLFSLTRSYYAGEFEPLTDATGGEIFNIYSSFSDILDFIAAEVAGSYVVSYRSSNPNRDGTERTVRIEATYDGKTVQDEATYIPGAAPDIQISESTKKLSDQGRAQGTPLTIQAQIQDDIPPALETATLYYKRSSNSENSYQSISLSNTEGDLYEAEIPGNDVSEPGVDYYITATDGSTTSSSPSTNPRSNPYNIAILPNEPPTIEHTPIGTAAPGQPLDVSFTAADGTNELERVTLYYRRTGRLNFESTTTVDDVSSQSEFTIAIPAEFLTTDGLEYYIEATDDLGISNTVGTSDEPLRVNVGVLVDIELAFPDNGPQSTTLEVPENGKAYIYYDVSSSESPLFHKDKFTLGLLDQTNSASYSTIGRVIGEQQIQVEVPRTIVQINSATQFRVANSFNVGDTTYSLGGQEHSFTATPVDQPYTRTWSIFAEGSAGVSGSIGSIGLGASVAAAKASISGTGGVGLDLQLNHDGDLAMTRKMESGVAASLKMPSVNLVVDDIQLVGGNVLTKGMAGQTVNFSEVDGIDENVEMMAQTGFFLETLSFSGAALSPLVGPIITASVATMNSLAGVRQYFRPAIVSEFAGMGVEGSVGVGVEFGMGSYSLSALKASSGVIMNGYMHRYPNTANKAPDYFYPELATFSRANSETASSTSFQFAQNFDLSLLDFNIGNAIVSTGTGSNMEIAGYWANSGELQHIDFGISNGGESEIFVANRSVYHKSTLEIPGTYISNLLDNESVVAGLVEPENYDIPFGTTIGEQFNNTVNNLTAEISNSSPLKIYNREKRGRGYEFGFDADIDAALGAGVGAQIGLNFQLYDEVEYQNNYIEIFRNGQNYVLNSSQYQSSMKEDKLSDVLDELISGTLPLIKEAWGNLLNTLEEAVSAGEEFLLDAANTASEAIGAISGIASEAGDYFISVFSPDSNRIKQKAFEKPEVKKMYSSPNVLYPASKNKPGKEELLDANSTLIVISDAMKVNFQPNGSTEPVEQLDTPVTLEMELKDEYLTENDFTAEDRDQVQLYRYNLQENGWVRVGGELNNGSISAETSMMGTYALGIEIQRENDEDAPQIYEADYLDQSENDGANVIYAKIRDNRYGMGIDFSNTHMILNDDTLSYTYQPGQERIFYELTEEQEQAYPVKEVEVIAADRNGNTAKKEFTFKANGTDSINSLPNSVVLHDNYPNPFNPQTTIPFEVPGQTEVEINIYDVLGRYIETVFEGEVRAGPHNVTWDPPTDRASGLYFYQIRTENVNQIKKMMYVK